MFIPYSYEIIAVDQNARCMEIVYRSEGRTPHHIGARLPYEGESLEAVVQMYSPVAHWLNEETPVQTVQVGITGSITQPEKTLDTTKIKKRSEIATRRYDFEASGVSVNGLLIRTDRDSQAVISSTHAAMQAGMLQTVQWKTADGTFATLDSAGILAIVQAVAVHVQNAFNIEKQLVDQLNAASTIEAVEAVQWPN